MTRPCPCARVARLAADSDLRRVAGLALLNLGYLTAARLVLAGGPMWPTLQQARGMTVSNTLWWVAFDADWLAEVRMLLGVVVTDRTRPVRVLVA